MSVDVPIVIILILSQKFIHHPIGLGLFGGHPVITVGISKHLVIGGAAMLGYDGNELIPGLLNLLGGDENIRRLAMRTAKGLVN